MHRARHPEAGPLIIPAPVGHQPSGPERPAIAPPAARELHWHLHFDGADPQEVAAIMRQIRNDTDAGSD